MKHFYLCCWFLLIAGTVVGQSSVYHPFPTDFGHWTYLYYDDFGAPTGPTTAYMLNGDTTIGNQNYKQVFRHQNYAGALREANKTIYFIPDTSAGNEYVLYDFNLQVGDTIVAPYGGAPCANNDTVVVWQIDSVLTSNGYYKQWHLSSLATWIEGIGSFNYLLEPALNLCVSGNDRLRCVTNDSLVLLGGNCNLGAAARTTARLKAYPNPSAGPVRLNLAEGAFTELLVRDMLGKTIRRIPLNGQESILLSGLKPGAYFVSAVDAATGKRFSVVIRQF